MEIAISLEMDEGAKPGAVRPGDMLTSFAAAAGYGLLNSAAGPYHLQIPEQDILTVCEAIKVLFHGCGVGVVLKVIE